MENIKFPNETIAHNWIDGHANLNYCIFEKCDIKYIQSVSTTHDTSDNAEMEIRI